MKNYPCKKIKRKTVIRKLLGLILTFAKVTEGKSVGEEGFGDLKEKRKILSVSAKWTLVPFILDTF